MEASHFILIFIQNHFHDLPEFLHVLNHVGRRDIRVYDMDHQALGMPWRQLQIRE